MKPSVKHLEGLHLTAADKRSILECIEFLRSENNHAMWLGRKGSPKRYCIAPAGETPNRYAVLIKENYRTDLGRPASRQSRHVVEVRGVDPLPLADWSIPQLDLF